MRTSEEWRIIETAPDYEISSLGRCRRCRPDWQGKYAGKVLSPGFVRGYARYTLCIDGRHVTRSAHVLVCETFNGPKPDARLHCAHRDDDKRNNTPENLYWATPQQNADDRKRNGRTFRGPKPPKAIKAISGENHWSKKNPDRVPRGESFWRTGTKGLGAVGERTGAAKLTEEQVLEILAEPKVHGSGRKLADKFGVSMGLITAIRKRRAWAYLDR